MRFTNKYLSSVLKVILIIECVNCVLQNGTKYDSAGNSRILSRRKRFLLFPEGSSFQLVFCVQTMAFIPIGDIFLYGSTAAIAWSLPTDPQIFEMFKEHKIAQRRQDSEKNIFYLDENGEVIAKIPYKRPQKINPAFSKRSIDDTITYKEKLRMKIDRMKMHADRLRHDFLKKDHVHINSLEFHRNSRLSLFEKMETFFNALGHDGRQCILHKLCVSGQTYTKQGTFLQEAFRTIFTLPKGSISSEEFDKAHSRGEDCDALYPGCDMQIPVRH